LKYASRLKRVTIHLLIYGIDEMGTYVCDFLHVIMEPLWGFGLLFGFFVVRLYPSDIILRVLPLTIAFHP
jgi:hypothetical protein